jgi:hypothetical protein
MFASCAPEKIRVAGEDQKHVACLPVNVSISSPLLQSTRAGLFCTVSAVSQAFQSTAFRVTVVTLYFPMPLRIEWVK